MTTVTIPLTTLPVGSRDFGPATVADTATDIVLVIDRTVAGGFNSLTAATTMDLRMFQSGDGGATWQLICGAGIVGGTYTGLDGAVITQSSVEAPLGAGTGREVKATLVVAGTSVAASGTLTIT